LLTKIPYIASLREYGLSNSEELETNFITVAKLYHDCELSTYHKPSIM